MAPTSEAAEVRIVAGGGEEDGAKSERATAGPGREREGRGAWANRVEYLLSCLSYSFNFTSLNMFPYTCLSNGGATFLIPYTVLMLLVGLPLVFLELSLGQFAGEGLISVWKVIPAFQGVGIAMVGLAFLTTAYFAVINSWFFVYFFASFSAELPWQTCDHWWNTENCNTLPNRFDNSNCTSYDTVMLLNGTCITEYQVTPEVWEEVIMEKDNRQSPAADYYNNFVLNISEDFVDSSGLLLQWRQTLCLLLAWAIVFLGLFKGIRSLGKAVYVTTIVPYILLVILFFRAVTLPGSGEGIVRGMFPTWNYLFMFNTWLTAALYVLYSLGPFLGGYIALGSYNKFTNNCLGDAVFITLAHYFTSFLSYFIVLGITGFLAHETNRDVFSVATSGLTVSFILVPEAVALMSLSQLWAVLFFVMYLCLVLGLQLVMVHNITLAMLDFFNNHKDQMKVCALVCVECCGVGLLMCTRVGMYILIIFDSMSSFCIMTLGFIQLVALCWVYSCDNLVKDVKLMLGQKLYLGGFWWISWTAAPLCPFSVLFSLFFLHSGLQYNHYIFPEFVNVLAWLLYVACLLIVPVTWAITRKKGINSCVPEAGWGSKRGPQDDYTVTYTSPPPPADGE